MYHSPGEGVEVRELTLAAIFLTAGFFFLGFSFSEGFESESEES